MIPCIPQSVRSVCATCSRHWHLNTFPRILYVLPWIRCCNILTNRCWRIAHDFFPHGSCSLSWRRVIAAPWQRLRGRVIAGHCQLLGVHSGPCRTLRLFIWESERRWSRYFTAERHVSGLTSLLPNAVKSRFRWWCCGCRICRFVRHHVLSGPWAEQVTKRPGCEDTPVSV